MLISPFSSFRLLFRQMHTELTCPQIHFHKVLESVLTARSFSKICFSWNDLCVSYIFEMVCERKWKIKANMLWLEKVVCISNQLLLLLMLLSLLVPACERVHQQKCSIQQNLTENQFSKWIELRVEAQFKKLLLLLQVNHFMWLYDSTRN